MSTEKPSFGAETSDPYQAESNAALIVLIRGSSHVLDLVSGDDADITAAGIPRSRLGAPVAIAK